MADTIIGTAGAFFTLVLIALASFFIGLIIFGVVDLAKVRHGQRQRRRHSSPRGKVTTSPLTLADHLHRSARHAAAAVLGTNGLSPDAPPPADAEAQWRVAVEFAAALLLLTEAHLETRLRTGHAETYLRALGDLCAGNLFRSHPGACGLSVHRLLAEARAALAAPETVPRDLLAPAPVLERRLAERIAVYLPPPPDAQRLQNTVSDLVRSSVALDIEPCLR
jgi:hypothetical protein